MCLSQFLYLSIGANFTDHHHTLRNSQCRIARACLQHKFHMWPPVQSKVNDISPSARTQEPLLIFFAPVKSCDFNGSVYLLCGRWDCHWTSGSHEPKRVSHMLSNTNPVSTSDETGLHNSKKFRKKLHRAKALSREQWILDPRKLGSPHSTLPPWQQN